MSQAAPSSVPLPSIHTAYLISLDGIIPLEVKVRILSHTPIASFPVKKAFWLKEGAIQYPPNDNWSFLTVDPSARGNPFEHPHVAWSVEDAVELYKQRQLKHAAYLRERAADSLFAAETLEQTDYYQLILDRFDPEDAHVHAIIDAAIQARQDRDTQPKPTTYTSPFTGQTK